MCISFVRTAVCLTVLATVASSAFAGTRGKPTKFNAVDPDGNPVAQVVPDEPVIVPVLPPAPADPATIVTETVVPSSPANCACNVPMMMPAPMMLPMPMMYGSACATCGRMGGGFDPAAAAAYGQAFPGGYYRSGAEAGMYHFPYYSYRRPWYFPGQPSFHRSTDLIW